MDTFTLILTLIAVILFVFVFFAVLILWHRSRVIKKQDILSEVLPGVSGAVKLFKLQFGRRNVLTNIYIPIIGDRKITGYVYADAIVITQTKIAVCRIRKEAGLIYCDDGFDWHQSARLRSGGTMETDFPDPTKNNIEAVNALRRLFDTAMIETPDIEGYVIFAARSVRFSCEKPNVFSLKDGYVRLKKRTHGGKISRKSKRTYRKLILTNSASKSKAERFNIKNLTEIT